MISVLIGLVVVAGGTWLLIDWRGTARWIHRYYDTRPEIDLKPRWFFWQFRPSEEQAEALAWLLSIAAIFAGAPFIANGLL
jgi:hypothetical protein